MESFYRGIRKIAFLVRNALLIDGISQSLWTGLLIKKPGEPGFFTLIRYQRLCTLPLFAQ